MVLGCLGTKITRKHLGEEYVTKFGVVIGPPVLNDGDKRLFLVIKVEENVEDKIELIKAVVRNDEKERILKDVAKRLTVNPNDPVYIFGKPVTTQWEEYVEGIDFEMAAIGVYDKHTESWDIILLVHGTRARDVIGSISWGTFILSVGKYAIKEIK